MLISEQKPKRVFSLVLDEAELGLLGVLAGREKDSDDAQVINERIRGAMGSDYPRPRRGRPRKKQPEGLRDPV